MSRALAGQVTPGKPGWAMLNQLRSAQVSTGGQKFGQKVFVWRENARAGECRLVAYGRVGHELPDFLRAAAGDGGLGSPLQRLLA
jgi:hypothetical protein